MFIARYRAGPSLDTPGKRASRADQGAKHDNVGQPEKCLMHCLPDR